MPKIIEIRKCLFKLQLKTSGVFFLRHSVVQYLSPPFTPNVTTVTHFTTKISNKVVSHIYNSLSCAIMKAPKSSHITHSQILSGLKLISFCLILGLIPHSHSTQYAFLICCHDWDCSTTFVLLQFSNHTFVIHHIFTLLLQAENLLVPQILPTRLLVP